MTEEEGENRGINEYAPVKVVRSNCICIYIEILNIK